MNNTTHSQQVSHYYDRNTWLFNMFGKTGGTKNIHASLWGPGVHSSTDASNYTNSLVLSSIQSASDEVKSVLDLGCGTGATLVYLEKNLAAPLRLSGVTLSARQAAMANRMMKSRHPGIEVHAANYHQLPESWSQQFDLGFAIESFVHSSDPESFFREAKRVLSPKGKLVLIDTFPEPNVHDTNFSFSEEVKDYQSCWKAGHIVDTNLLSRLANQQGFELIYNEDLTGYVETDRPRDRWIAGFNKRFKALTTLHPYLVAMRGGNAVQAGFRNGWLRYRHIILQSCAK